jgi:4-amino-4-deoxy-L-arabinose transferase-like glycosyltransferase
MLSRLSAYLERLTRRWFATLAGRTGAGLAVVVLVAGLCYLPGLTRVPAVDRTEGVVALASRHILETGNPFDPRSGETLQVFRPAGTFWVQAAALAPRASAQRTEISAYRLPSFLATIIAVGLIFLLGRGLFGAEPALIAALAVGVTPIVALHAQLAIAEPLILPLIVLAQFALFGAYRAVGQPQWLGWRGVFWAALGVSTWFNALAVPFLALAMVLGLAVADRSLRPVRQLGPWLGLPLFLLVALPWLVSLWIIGEGQPFAGLGWTETLDVLEGGQAMKFKTVYGVFILFVALAFIPVSHMLGPALVRGWSARQEKRVRFVLIWLLVPIAALEIFSNKPPLYTVQAVFPAAALIVALAVTGRLGGTSVVRAWPGFFWGATVFVTVAIPLLAGGLLWLTGTVAGVVVVAGAVVIIALFILAGWAAERGEGRAWIGAALAGTVTLDLWFFGALMPGLDNTWTAPQIRRTVDELAACGVRDVVIAGFREPSLPLRLGGRARITTGADAGQRVRRGEAAAAIIEARDRAAFSAGLGPGTSGADGTREWARRGCIRSINMARGCLLEFDVEVPTSAAGCPLSAPAHCPTTGRDTHWLEINHCK